MTATKFVLQGRALGLEVYGFRPTIRFPNQMCLTLKQGRVVSTWATKPQGNTNKHKFHRHRSVMDAVKSYESLFFTHVITDPIIRAAHGMGP